MEAAGPEKVWTRPVREQSFGYHLLGTCRMGNDAQNSVVDKYHRAHDVPNLFICDGSSFVTSGRGSRPAQYRRLLFGHPDHIVRMAKNGDQVGSDQTSERTFHENHQSLVASQRSYLPSPPRPMRRRKRSRPGGRKARTVEYQSASNPSGQDAFRFRASRRHPLPVGKAWDGQCRQPGARRHRPRNEADDGEYQGRA